MGTITAATANATERRTTPSASYLTDAWYPAAWSEEVDDGLFGITLCDEQLVLVRGSDGAVSALSDICPHRFASLSTGERIEADRIQCPYHGLEFALDGRCVANPHGPVPGVVKLSTYRAVERHSIVWIWNGDVSNADDSFIPDLSFLTEPSYRTVRGRLKTQANYELITDNLLDLTHVGYVHAGGIGSNAISKAGHEVILAGTTIFSNRWCPDAPAAPVWSALFGGYSDPVDHWLNMRWDAPASMVLDVGVTPTGEPREQGITTWGAHLLAPETETSTHYLFAAARDFALDDPALDGHLKFVLEQAFVAEDRPLLEQIARNMKGRPFDAMRPLILPFDEAAVRARRLLAAFREGKKRKFAPRMAGWASFSRQPDREMPVRTH
ncbi:MAG: aromatic ring-hydroxylating dioxygenase subunit alpha [Gemmatimonadaceae bacterium]|nr:aromatic ring-hydroxylating dioxygenase subunit alpha [Acetobacteraceae bacterium]